MPAPLTEAAIEKVRRLIVDGGLRPGDRLPAEQELGVQLGLSRTSAREAVRALVNARVLDVRRVHPGVRPDRSAIEFSGSW